MCWLVVGRESHRHVEFGSFVVGPESRRWSWVVKRHQEESLSLSFSRSCARGPASGLSEEAQQSRLWGVSLRVRVGNAGESSLTTPGARGQARLRKAVGSRRRDLPTVAPRGRG